MTSCIRSMPGSVELVLPGRVCAAWSCFRCHEWVEECVHGVQCCGVQVCNWQWLQGMRAFLFLSYCLKQQGQRECKLGHHCRMAC